MTPVPPIDRNGRVQAVVAAVQVEAVGHLGHEAGRARRVLRGVLHADHRRDLAGEAHQHLGVHLPSCADRDVVDQERQVGGVTHGPEVRLEPGLAGAVVVRGDHEQAVDAGLGGPRRQLDGVPGVEAARSGHERHGDRLPHRGPEVDRLVVGQRRGLAGGAGQHQAVGALVDQPRGQRRGTVQVQRQVVVERRDHGHQHRSEPSHQPSLPVSADRSSPSVASRSSCSSNHTEWNESMSGLSNHSPCPARTSSTARWRRLA